MTNLSGANLNNGSAVGPQGEGRESPSTFPKYPAYKESGVEWLGDVPEHWGVRPLKWLAEQVTDKATTSEFQVGLENIEGWTGRFIETDTEFAGDGIAFRQEDILFGKLRPYLAKVWLADRPGQAVGDFFVLRPRAVNSEFLHKYILTPTVIEDLNASTIGAKMPRVGWEDMAALAVPLPPHKEQTQIARFLNHETSRIDALIEEQQGLIELLKEKRQAVISHAVTKGLDPTVPMKDSGVEWLGEVPAHWDVKALRRVLKESLSNGVFKKKEDFGRGALLVNVFDVYRQNFQVNYSSLDRVDCNAAEISSYSVLPGDLFFVRSSLKYEGIAVVAVAGECSEPVVYECHLICARPDPAVFNGRYGSYLFNSSNYRATMISKSKLTTMTTIDQEAISSTFIPTPPLSEQAEISAFLDREINKVDQLIGEADSVCELLKERRSALISAAVTGKIDIRGWQQPASAQAPELEVAEAV
jgi:type I restriction enzyme S subunit